jgi:methionyl-tRNA synthetase
MSRHFSRRLDIAEGGQHYERVNKAIQDCGGWAKIEYSFFYVSSKSTLSEITSHIWASMDPNDKLIVIDATNNNS